MKVIFFNSDIAVEYGVDEAVVIQNLSYWIEKNEANGKHFYDGRFWTYNSADAFTKLFPFWNSRQIRRILKSLEDKGVIITGNYNTSAFDRTTWYAFSDSFLKKCNIDIQKSVNGDAESGKSILQDIDNNPSIDTNKEADIDTAEGGLFPTLPTKKQKGTTEPLCLFANSRYYQYEVFASFFQTPEFAGIDIAYYYYAVADWSSSKSKKRADWIATARNFIRSDIAENKVKRLQDARPTGRLSQEDIDYLNEMSIGL